MDEPRSADESNEDTREARSPEVHDSGLLPLHTPADAARILAVRESWLRRRAGERRIPCTFLGRHLRFSHADVIAIAADGAQPPHTPPRPGTHQTRPGRRHRPASPERRAGRRPRMER